MNMASQHTVTWPSECDDDDRMSFLFSAFKENRDVNSSDWDSKMTFWIPLILKHAKTNGLISVTLRQLQADFTRKGRVPLGLGTVIQEMIRQGALHKESDFVAGITNGWLTWSMRQLVIKPLQWTVGAVLGHQISPDEVLVVPEVIKERASLALQKYKSSHLHSLPLLSEEELRSHFTELCPDNSALNLVLLQLQREKKICMLERAGKKLIKFVQSGAAHVTPVSESDLGIYDLKQSETLLSERLQSTWEESDRLKEEARSYSQAGNKQQALRCLRRRKLAERRISDLQSKLDNVQSILERISAAETDRKVISAYQTGVSALRLALIDVNLEKAESLVDQIQEFCDLQDDLNQTLSGATFNEANLDSEELEKELDEILQREEVLSNKEMHIDLPDVPTGPMITTPQQPILEFDDRASPPGQSTVLSYKPALDPMFQ
ncbi:charged multivesicular body protein 7 [Bombina bombina]|uniref:charged multivesicular body protein 7 n=1 Tax=Bombina bombina TaxID=8345 RepID=UPI00235A51CA|nr:charged multivesicular body protein 7 [Bombina bombina]XP_053573959.1 charged multivesicular body protein 7 [Bombina bombina]XP_053573960.1 charged multivesicular body protein 7 [Bombina bombina]XP_053573961.1 charged multivesicular body protein 7 [Bombina bombina]